MGVTQLMAGLVVAAAACLGVDALQADVRADALREGVSSVNIARDVGSSHGASQTFPDVVRDGYDIWVTPPPPMERPEPAVPEAVMYGLRGMSCNCAAEITNNRCCVQILSSDMRSRLSRRRMHDH